MKSWRLQTCWEQAAKTVDGRIWQQTYAGRAVMFTGSEALARDRAARMCSELIGVNPAGGVFNVECHGARGVNYEAGGFAVDGDTFTVTAGEQVHAPMPVTPKNVADLRDLFGQKPPDDGQETP